MKAQLICLPDAGLSSSSSVRFAHEEAAQVLADLSRLAPHGQRRRPTVQDLLTLWRLPGLRSTARRVKRVQSPYLDIASTAMRLLAEGSTTLANIKARRRSRPFLTPRRPVSYHLGVR
jgi:hypothetical protein